MKCKSYLVGEGGLCNDIFIQTFDVNIDREFNLIHFFLLTAAVTALAKFGAHCEELLPSCTVLLER